MATLRDVAPGRHGCDGTKAGVERPERAVGERGRPTLMPANTGAEQSGVTLPAESVSQPPIQPPVGRTTSLCVANSDDGPGEGFPV